MKCLSLLSFLAAGTLAALALSAARSELVSPESERATGAHAIPAEFAPVETRRLLGSPDPLPLEPVRAFPHLSFHRPVELTHAGDGTDRIFVLEQRGVIRVFENDDETREARDFLDIQDLVSRDHNEEGLLGLAFHPDYADNGEFFVYYSVSPRASVLSRFRVSADDPDRADRASQEEVLRIDQPFGNHNGGSIRFGPDRYLYVGLGDGGAADDPFAHAQNLRTLLGSILRIDVDRREEGLAYGIPGDNPFAGREDARGEIWAYGLRNVWRMAFDRETGELWGADVGQDRFEEVNLIEKGGNYGWNIREGFNPFEPNTPAKQVELIDPLVEYHREDGESVTGGLVYRGPTLTDYDGAYFYADYVHGNVWALHRDEGGSVDNRLVARTELEPTAFGEDQEGEMYICSFDDHIYRLRAREVDLEEVARAFPRTLSETGLFASVEANEPAEGLIPYELNMPFWSDFAVKDRYVALPENETVTFHERDKWEFPVGTVFVKTFWLHRDRVDLKDPLRLETRLLVRSPRGWDGYTYVYNDEQTEAHLLDDSLIKPVEVRTDEGPTVQHYYIPSRRDCFACHTRAEGFVLGTTTRQMNRTLHYRGESENQIALLERLNVFKVNGGSLPDELERFPDWNFGNLDRSGSDREMEKELGIPDVEIDVLARAWLEVNCAVCHRPKGIAPHARDMRFHIPVEEMNLIRQQPKQGQLGPPDVLLIKPGAPRESELFFRVARRGPRQMPPVASNLADERGLEVLRKWIAGMDRGD